MFQISDIKITKSKRNSIALVVHPNGIVEVRAPKYLPDFTIRAFVKSKSTWIEERLKFVAKKKTLVRKFEDGNTFMFMGKEYPLKIGNFLKIEIMDGMICFPLGMIPNGRVHLEKWYIRQAKAVVKKLVDEYAVSMNTSINGLSFSDTSSKWGSCTHDNRLQFNWRLIMAPLLVIRYVVIHELAHTTEKNHKVIFWNIVRRHNPSHKAQLKWLKENGNLLKF